MVPKALFRLSIFGMFCAISALKGNWAVWFWEVAFFVALKANVGLLPTRSPSIYTIHAMQELVYIWAKLKSKQIYGKEQTFVGKNIQITSLLLNWS